MSQLPNAEEKLTNEELLSQLQVDPKIGLSPADVQAREKKYGPNTIEEVKKTFWQKIAQYFWGPIPWMIEAAILLSLIAGDWRDFFIISALLFLNAFIGWRQDKSATDALGALKKDLALKAEVLRAGRWEEVNTEGLVPGDIIKITLGDIVPADARLIDGKFLSVDQSALTGESMPVEKVIGDEIYSGSIVKEGAMTAVVIAIGSHTYFGKTAKLVAHAGTVSHLNEEVKSVGTFLIKGAIVFSIVLIIFELIFIRPLDSRTILEIVKTVLVLLVATIPVAMPAVISVTISIGALNLSKFKAIVSKLDSIEALASMEILCSDKTGTLTLNDMQVKESFPAKGFTADDMSLYGSLASAPHSQDPIDKAVLHTLKDPASLKGYEVISFNPFNPVSKMISAEVKKDDKEMWVSKGAPQVILKMCSTTMDPTDLKNIQAQVAELAKRGFKALGVAEGDGKTWNYVGMFSLGDPLRPESKETVKMLQDEKIVVKMVTGDSIAIAEEVGRELGIGDKMYLASAIFGRGRENKVSITPEITREVVGADGFAEVFPQDKYEIVKVLQKDGYICGMTGDGVNDAPALKQADCGIAVSDATDAARAAAALILTAPGLVVIADAINESKKIFARMMSYIYYRIAMTINIMIFSVLITLCGAFLLYRIRPEVGVSYFPLTAIMLVSLALLDDIPIMTIAYDNTQIPPRPEIWNKKKIFTTSSVLGLVSVVQSTILIIWADNSWPDIATFGQLQTLVFLQLVVGGHLLLFVTRRSGWFFTKPYPEWKLFWAIVVTQIFVVFMTGLGWFVEPISWILILYVWIYNLLWMLPLSFISVLMRKNS